MKVVPGEIRIFCDGACSGNPGPGGWGTIIADYDKDKVIELGGAEARTTNNRMEMTALLKGLEVAGSQHAKILNLMTDSTYVIRGCQSWMHGWKRRGWKTQEGLAVQNQDLWEKLSEELQRIKNQGTTIGWHYVRGHMGTPGNERVDTIAVQVGSGSYVHLYRGPWRGYSVDLEQLPESTALPAMSQQKDKPKAIGYLSMIGGQLMRHKTWAACERRVKGHSGAKFKKFEKESDQGAILKSWGQSDSAEIAEDPTE
ncbi:MAG: viroplasmin family protein [Bdellovibrionales bacterium]|nr:viroplasmin family protein [Bdellovibrionales bacterium]